MLFHLTTELAIKFEPLTVNVNAAPPAVALVGLRLVSTGIGLPAGGFTVRLTELDNPPPGNGLKTVIGNEPPVCTSAAVICAVN